MARSISAIRGMTSRLLVRLLNLGKQSIKSIFSINIIKLSDFLPNTGNLNTSKSS